MSGPFRSAFDQSLGATIPSVIYEQILIIWLELHQTPHTYFDDMFAKKEMMENQRS